MLNDGGPPGPFAVLRSHAAPVGVIRFLNLGSHSGSTHSPATLVSGDQRGIVFLWDLASRRVAHRVDAHVHEATGHSTTLSTGGVLAVDAAGGRLLTQGRDGLVKVWDIAEGRTQTSAGPSTSNSGKAGSNAAAYGPLRALQERSSFNTFAATFCKFSVIAGAAGSGPTLIAAPAVNPSQLDVWDLRARTVAASFVPPCGKAGSGGWGMCTACKLLRSVGAMAGHRLFVAAVYEDGHLRIFDGLRPGSAPAITAKLLDDVILSIAVNVGSTRGVVVGAGASASAFALDLKTFRVRVARCFPLGGKVRDGAGEVVLREWDERIFATAGWDGRVRIFDWNRLRPLAILKHHEASVCSLAFSPHPVDARSIHDSVLGAVASDTLGCENAGMPLVAVDTENGLDGHQRQPLGDGAGVVLASASKDARIALWKIY